MKILNDIPIDFYINDPNTAIEKIASLLVDGSLALAVGAGISKNLGLPLWWKLVDRCLKKAGISKNVNKNTPNEDLRKYMELAESNNKDFIKYRELVAECLYYGIDYSKSIIKNDLLIALGALLMGSKRGSISEVINFNFDDILEWYLHLHGFYTQVHTTMPCILLKKSDVTTYHPNGYLPKEIGSPSDFLIFSQLSYDQRDSEYYDHWTELFCNVMRNKVVLFIGLSGDDPQFGKSLVRVQKEIERYRFTGFWIFGQKKEKELMAHLTKRNIVPLCFDHYDSIPTFLLKICQKAVELY